MCVDSWRQSGAGIPLRTTMGQKVSIAIQDAIRVENEVRQTKAQAEKNVAQASGEARARVTIADGEAKANHLLSSSVTPALLEWKRWEATLAAVNKWDGVRPTVEGSGAGLLLSISPASK